MKKKHILVNIGLFLFVVLFCLVIFEVVSHFFFTTCVTYRNCPKAQYSVETIEYNMDVNLNSEGFRDKEFSAAPEDSIAIIGDSFVFGWGVDEQETFVGLLEKKFSRDDDRDDNRVLNLGIEGTGLEHYVQRLDEYGGNADTVVLVFFTINDIIPEEQEKGLLNVVNYLCSSFNSCTLAHKMMYLLRNNNIGHNGRANPLANKDISKVNVDPELLNLALEWKISPYTVQAGIELPDLNQHYLSVLQNFDAVHLNKELLEQFIETTQHHEQRLVVVLLPPNFLVSDEYADTLSKLGHSQTVFNDLTCDTKLHSSLKEFLKTYDVEIIDLQEDMCDSGAAGQFYYEIDGHLTPKGNEFVADVIYEQLLMQKTTSGRNDTAEASLLCS